MVLSCDCAFLQLGTTEDSGLRPAFKISQTEESFERVHNAVGTLFYCSRLGGLEASLNPPKISF